MVSVGSIGNEEGIWGSMERVESGRVDVEEGEISDSASVEEISAEDFNKQDGSDSKPKGGTESRVWTMRDLYNYPGFRTGWYNLAWAQGLQNKPLNGIYVMDVDSKLSSSKEVDRVVIDDSGDEAEKDKEKEEGELEEGEIDLDSEPLAECDSATRLSSIRDALGSVDSANAEQSFEEVCSRIHGTLEGLRVLLLEGEQDGVVQMLFSAVQIVNSVFCSMTLNQKGETKEALSRLLSSVANSSPPLLSSGPLKEIELMIASLNSIESTSATDEEKETQNSEQVQDIDTDLTTSNADSTGQKRSSKWQSVSSVIHSKPITSPEVLRPGVPAFKGRGLLLPLLDLHKDHDEDSLPSPTRDAPSCFPVQKPLSFGDGIVKSGSTVAKAAAGAEDSRLRQYETDAFKAVSTYQQKFNRSSFLMYDRLPSPTPSGEESDDGDDDTSKEISSSSTGGNFRTTTSTPVLRPSVVSPSVPATNLVSQAPIPAKLDAPPSTVSFNPAMKALAKSRDPRLRFANSDLGALDLNQKSLTAVQKAPKIETSEHINSRKQKAGDEPNLDGSSSKRQRTVFESAGTVSDAKSVSGVGGWLEDNVTTVPPQLVSKNQLMENAEADPRRSLLTVNHSTTNGLTIGKDQVPMMSTVNSLPDLLKDIAGNPEILLNILKGQQQRLAVAQQKSDPVKEATHPSTENLIPGSAPLALVSIPPLKAPGVQALAGSPSVTSQVGPMRTQDESGKIRMKPRDPRRVLHGNTLQKTGSLVNEQLKTTAAPMTNKDNLNDKKVQEGQAEKKPIPSQSVVAPDIARQFTKNLRNIADIMSVSAPQNQAIVSQNPPSQPAQVKADRGAVKAIALNTEDQQSGTATPEPTVPGPSKGPNTWGDVEHLFNAYDDQQKLAIQRERERRLEEQKKMFEARKLCLVLDLDHTLLNSAKFGEVDVVHDEILRKKEEQDREKSQRHLFRLHHMAMWTKLRPGIWNFLDKASKLFELHLYTMGNKLYATEMAKVLDPKGTLFSGRVISRGDDEDPSDGDERVPKSKDLEGVMGMESSVVIIDDSVRVWPHNKLNLIVVERYTYFPCSRRQFGLPGPSLLEIDHDERPEDGTLASSLGVIERIHQKFFSHHSLDEADVRNILASEQQKILAGCRIVFSRVFPVSEVNPHLHPLWQTAQQFGAVCTTQIDDQVTHVVANSPGTDKVNWALANGRFAVHPGWVEASALLYRRANEQDFAIKPTPP